MLSAGEWSVQDAEDVSGEKADGAQDPGHASSINVNLCFVHLGSSLNSKLLSVLGVFGGCKKGP